jgi:cytochrome P450
LREAAGELLGNGLLTSEGEFWKKQRKLVQPAFHHQRIAAYTTTMVQQTLEHIAQWKVGETYDIGREMVKLTLGIVNKTLFNIDMRTQADVIGHLIDVLLAAAQDRLNAYNPVWERIFKRQRQREVVAMNELFSVIDGIIAEHRKKGEDSGDLLSMLLAARDDDGGAMSEKQLRDEVLTLFVAGHETTAHAVAWAFYLLSQNPSAEAKLMQEVATLGGKPPTFQDLAQLPYSDMVFKETIRLYPPAAGATRAPIHDIVLGGYHIPKDSNLTIVTYVMHRDPVLFPAPLKFDPERFSPEREANIPKYSYLPFGGGPRICIGNVFAAMEARLIMTTILQKFRLSLVPGQLVRAEQVFTIRPKGGLKMVVEKA